MADRTVTDSDGRTWTCAVVDAGSESSERMGRDVVLTCGTPTVGGPVLVTVGWQWENMSDNGLARLISQASPVPRR